LQEDALIPVNTKKDKQILNYLKQQKSGGDGVSDDTTMRSSFYSSQTSQEHRELLPKQDLESTNKSQTTVSMLQIRNILELSQQEMKIVTEIKKFMKEQE
jgi:hypothetical protein